LKEAAMPDFQLSLAPSRLSQVINPWSLSVGPLFTVNLGNSGDNEIEARVLARVGTYGRQIGQIGDAVGVLLSLIDADVRARLPPEKQKMLLKLENQLKLVETIKEERRLGKQMGTDSSTQDGVKMVPPTAATTTIPAGATLS
jgi:hypothetical protein